MNGQISCVNAVQKNKEKDLLAWRGSLMVCEIIGEFQFHKSTGFFLISPQREPEIVFQQFYLFLFCSLKIDKCTHPHSPRLFSTSPKGHWRTYCCYTQHKGCNHVHVGNVDRQFQLICTSKRQRHSLTEQSSCERMEHGGHDETEGAFRKWSGPSVIKHLCRMVPTS